MYFFRIQKEPGLLSQSGSFQKIEHKASIAIQVHLGHYGEQFDDRFA